MAVVALKLYSLTTCCWPWVEVDLEILICGGRCLRPCNRDLRNLRLNGVPHTLIEYSRFCKLPYSGPDRISFEIFLLDDSLRDLSGPVLHKRSGFGMVVII
jgi:hypothetical protein